ncbi:threonine--tRNA ligase [Candidatus Parcubacteria bacterium]|nr:threonine--tRNA ligase [Candidatus Parcubacteria bacterium]
MESKKNKTIRTDLVSSEKLTKSENKKSENESESGLETQRHSISHIMALAVKTLWPGVKFGIGPSIENGFYYDFDFGKTKLSEEDLPKIEAKIRDLLKQNLAFKKKNISKTEAKKLFKDQPYKLELIKNLPGRDVSIYESGGFVDLCKGPHVKNTSEINPKAFKLSRVAGAYWLGDEKNPMLTRIYGLHFETEKELSSFVIQQAEAEKRDHRVLGQKLDLFSFHPEAPGMPFFHPKGSIVYNELYNFWLKSQQEFGYDFVLCPSMLNVSIWKQSGHWDHYKNDMFFTKAEKGEEQFALRPMDCPGAILIYNNTPKSYRDLPLRYAEPGLITRKEKSGQLGGLFRVQQFKQDDAHIFITEEQIENEIKQVIKLVDKIYKPFGFEYKPYLSTRPDNSMGDPKVWAKAENQLKKILNEVYGKNWDLKEKDGAFYGPKIDYQLKDCLGRTWQCATIQLDFQMPLKFNCQYTAQNGKQKAPVLIHRTIMGSFERFIGVLIEHYAGAFPLWLSPVQVKILPITERHNDYALGVAKKLKEQNIRVETALEADTLGKKIREAEMKKIPYLLIVGDKEIANKNVAVRQRGKGDLGSMPLPELTELLLKEITSKK